MEKKDPNIYVVCDYGATGEGTTVMTLITRAIPRRDDYVKESWIDENGKFHYESETKNTPEERALREFNELFGDYFGIGAKILDRYEFFHHYSEMVPPALYKLCDPDSEYVPPGFSWHGSLHFNYS
jgi:hypothetical protein